MSRRCAAYRQQGPLRVNDSLSIIIPVRDAEATLTEQVHHLLDLLPDLTSRFEIVVVDDGSSDHTADVARDLARQYPQLRLICHAEMCGRDAAVRTGLVNSQGETVLVQEDFAFVSPTNLRRLWALRHDEDVVMARTERQRGVFDPAMLDRLNTWGKALRNLARRASPGGIQMIRRDAAQFLAGSNVALHDVPAVASDF
jgi:glycosyltransferase involved in cell wall biosynthesis